MNKRMICSALVGIFILIFSNANARIFFLNQSDLALVWEAFENTGGGYSYLINGGHYYPLGEGYQFYGQHANRPVVNDNWVEMGIGAVLEKSASWQSDTLIEIGGDNLEGYDEFSMIFSGGPFGWWINLYVETGYANLGEPNIRYYGEWTQFDDNFVNGVINKSTYTRLDLSNIPFLNHVTGLGFVVGRYLDPDQVQTFAVQAYPASTSNVESFDQGTYNSGYGYPSHSPDETEAVTGVTGYTRPENPGHFYAHYHNAFIVFDLTNLNNYISYARLNLMLARYDSRDSSESFNVYDVTSPIEELMAGGRHLWDSIGSDLQNGKIYGSSTVNDSDLGSVISIELSEAAISDLNKALGGFFAVGIHSTTDDNPDPGVYNIDLIGFGELGDGVQNLELTLHKALKVGTDLDSDCDVDGYDIAMSIITGSTNIDMLAKTFGQTYCN